MIHPLDPYTYTLVDRQPVNCKNDDGWFVWFLDMNNRRIALDQIGDVSISTVFCGIDHSYGTAPQPIVFETMISGGEHDGRQSRSASWEEAEAAHAEAMMLVRGQ
jgi:hypothetical protein